MDWPSVPNCFKGLFFMFLPLYWQLLIMPPRLLFPIWALFGYVPSY
jgi:hypothetical protein